jgi:1,4-dihydroxy-2-naphthoate polyprenyltransferase
VVRLRLPSAVSHSPLTTHHSLFSSYLPVVLHKSTIQLLRFHFSLFLLPVYLFALSQVKNVNWSHAVLVFVILHILVYPSSNGYNSYMDKDTTPIGGLHNPMQPTRQLFYISVIMDIVAVALSFVVSIYFSAGVFLYILASRAYSYRGIRLKKYPVLGYLVVVLFQGAETFFLTYHGCSEEKTLHVPLLPMIAASLLIGGSYPLTQVYQHNEDLKDGVKTISYILGKKGTFLFAGFIFALATLTMFFTFYRQNNLDSFLIFLASMLPMVWFFVIWMRNVWRDETKANFKNSFLMNLLASLSTTICFLILIFLKYV